MLVKIFYSISLVSKYLEFILLFIYDFKFNFVFNDKFF